jgi:hypothetical protein
METEMLEKERIQIKEEKIEIQNKIKFEKAIITIIGDSDLILNKMTESAAQELADKQEGKVQGAKKNVNMYEQLVASIHWLKGDETNYTEEGWKNALQNNIPGYPSSGMKKALCDAVVRVLGETYSTKFNANVQILDSFLPIKFESSSYDKSLLSPQRGKPVLCYRNVFRNWESSFTIKYIPDNYSLEQIIEAITCAGFACGIGSHRPSSKGGSNGMFHIKSVIKLTTE